MKSLQRVVWSDGMLMAPQHFQQQDLYHEALVGERLLYTAPHAWGAYTLELDTEALAASQIVVRAFRGVLPRGTVLSFLDGEPEAPPARAIEQHFPAHRAELEVFLALPIERPGVASYTQDTAVNAARTRHIIESRSVLDAMAPSEALTVEFARRNTMLLFAEEVRDDFEAIKVAEVIRDRAGKLCFSPTYVPPAVRVGVSEFLRDGLRRALSASVAKRRSVAEERRQRDECSVEFGADEVSRYLAMSALSRAIPVLKHLLDDGQASPAQAYVALLQFAGELTTFSADDDPMALPPYLHGDLRATFEPLFAKLMSLLNLSIAGKVVTMELEPRADGMHLGRIRDTELLRPDVRFVLAVQAQAPEHTVYELLPRVAKVASWSEVPTCLSAALSGVTLVASPRPPREIPVRAGKCYFLLATDHAGWRGIASERAIAVHLPPPFDPKTTTVELFAIPRG